MSGKQVIIGLNHGLSPVLCCIVISFTPNEKLQRNLNRNMSILIHEDIFENSVYNRICYGDCVVGGIVPMLIQFVTPHMENLYHIIRFPCILMSHNGWLRYEYSLDWIVLWHGTQFNYVQACVIYPWNSTGKITVWPFDWEIFTYFGAKHSFYWD